MLDYNEGDTIEYQANGGGEFRKVVVQFKDDDIKNGESGFEGTTLDGDNVWGYDDQITRVLSRA